MDFAKGFDQVPYRRLAYKLEYYGIRNDTLKWITTWLPWRTQKVVIDGVSSDSVPVPLGSVLGPILFLIFINDLPDNKNCIVRLFVYDCVLYRNIRMSVDQHILQDDLNKLAQWEEAWLMKFNVAKCHSIERLRNRPCTCTSKCSSIFAIFIPSKILNNEKESRQKFWVSIMLHSQSNPNLKKNEILTLCPF